MDEFGESQSKSHTTNDDGLFNLEHDASIVGDALDNNESSSVISPSSATVYILLYSSLDNPTDSSLKSYTTKLGSISPKKNVPSRYLCVGYVDADNEESFTLETFKSMINSSYQQKKVFILARVTTCDPVDSDKLYHSFYYAAQINRVLFRLEKQRGALPTFLHRMHAKNPLNNMPIIGDVEYFIITPEDVDISRQSCTLDYEDPSYLKASALDLETYLLSEKNISKSQLDYVDQLCINSSILYRAHYLASDEDFLRCSDLRSYFYRNNIYEDCSFFEYQRPIESSFAGIGPFPHSAGRYGLGSDVMVLNPDRMVIDISTLNPEPPYIICTSFFSNKSKLFRRNFFIIIITCYLCCSFALLIFIIPDSLKGIIGIAMVIGLCAVLILFIENDRYSMASSTAAAILADTERRRLFQLQLENQSQVLSTNQEQPHVTTTPSVALFENMNNRNIDNPNPIAVN